MKKMFEFVCYCTNSYREKAKEIVSDNPLFDSPDGFDWSQKKRKREVRNTS